MIVLGRFILEPSYEVLRRDDCGPPSSAGVTVIRGLWLWVIIAVVLLCILFPLTSKAQLKVGDRAPDFALQDQKGQTIKLSDFLGKKSVVLAFYIKASTPG